MKANRSGPSPLHLNDLGRVVMQISKSNRDLAVRNMVRSVFSEKCVALMERRERLAYSLYINSEQGQTGAKLEDELGDAASEWLHYISSVKLVMGWQYRDRDKPERGWRWSDPFPKPEALWEDKRGIVRDLVSGTTDPYGVYNVYLRRSVPWPARARPTAISGSGAVFCVSLDGDQSQRRQARELKKAIDTFNKNVASFIEDTTEVVMSLNTVKKVENHFPELLGYLPAELKRGGAKQEMVPVNTIERVKNRIQQAS